jgi:hypothetical protein
MTPSTATPDTDDTRKRMLIAFEMACRVFGATGTDSPTTWGWKVRTLSGAINLAAGPAWLRIARMPHGHPPSVFWTGNRDAHRELPASVPRPRLLRGTEFGDDAWDYCAEAFELLPASLLSGQPTTPWSVLPPQSWWQGLRTALRTVAGARTSRFTIQPDRLDAMMGRVLGSGHHCAHPSLWEPAHGDLHWANLTGPSLQILDWEGWGMAPPGYDAATLLAYSLPDPAVAEAVHRQFTDQLDTPVGRCTQRAVLSEQLWARWNEPSDEHTAAMSAALGRHA